MATRETVEPREIVKANNDLFRCKYKLKDIVASRIFMAFASLVNHDDVKENESFVEYRISADSILSDKCDGGDNYKQLHDAARILVGHQIELNKHEKHFRYYTLFSMIDYDSGIITGQFHKDLVPFFIIAKERFTKMRLDEYMILPSIYSQALFGFLKSWNDMDKITIKVSELHELLGTPESFKKNFTDFRRWVLDKAHKDINKLTSLKYDYEAVKDGRSYKEIKFIFHKEIEMRRTKFPKGCIPSNAPVKNQKSLEFEDFFNEFKNAGGIDVRVKARKQWMSLYESGNAPLAKDVSDENKLSVMDFLKQWQAGK